MGKRAIREARRVHACGRAMRYGVHLDCDGYEKLNESIRNGEATFLSRESESRTHWLVVHEGTSMHAVYYKKYSMIVTFLMMRKGAACKSP